MSASVMFPQLEVQVLGSEEQTLAADSAAMVLGLWQGEGVGEGLGVLPADIRHWIELSIAARGFNAAAGERLLLSLGKLRLACCGMGRRDFFATAGFDEQASAGRATNQAVEVMTGAQTGEAAWIEWLAGCVKALQQEGRLEELCVLLPGESGLSVEVLACLTVEAVMLAGYRFEAYLSQPKGGLQRLWLRLPPTISAKEQEAEKQAAMNGAEQGLRIVQGVFFARDLINCPAADAHPDAVAQQAVALAQAAGARVKSLSGEALKEAGFAAIYAVGRAAEHPPWLLRLEHGPADAPELSMVGKGVCFDSGGLDIKPTAAMQLMKKDLGGAAIVLGAFWALAGLQLPLRISAVVGLAENAIGPLAFRPGDILRTKSGISVEVTNTDAEGRLVLADAFHWALESNPTHLVDFATLTGACRVALGKNVMGLFCNHAPWARVLKQASAISGDACWQLPLYSPYRRMLKSPVADIANAATEGFAGAITAALFLQNFIGSTPWAHLDCYAWSDGSHPLHPEGGSAQGVRLMVAAARQLAKASSSTPTRPLHDFAG